MKRHVDLTVAKLQQQVIACLLVCVYKGRGGQHSQSQLIFHTEYASHCCRDTASLQRMQKVPDWGKEVETVRCRKDAYRQSNRSRRNSGEGER